VRTAFVQTSADSDRAIASEIQLLKQDITKALQMNQCLADENTQLQMEF
jgi:hypothetical protein